MFYFVSHFYPLYQIKPKKNLPDVSVQKKWQGENWKGGRKGRKQWKETTGVEGLLWLKKNKGCNVLIFTV